MQRYQKFEEVFEGGVVEVRHVVEPFKVGVKSHLLPFDKYVEDERKNKTEDGLKNCRILNLSNCYLNDQDLPILHELVSGIYRVKILVLLGNRLHCCTHDSMTKFRLIIDSVESYSG